MICSPSGPSWKLFVGIICIRLHTQKSKHIKHFYWHSHFQTWRIVSLLIFHLGVKWNKHDCDKCEMTQHAPRSLSYCYIDLMIKNNYYKNLIETLVNNGPWFELKKKKTINLIWWQRTISNHILSKKSLIEFKLVYLSTNKEYI